MKKEIASNDAMNGSSVMRRLFLLGATLGAALVWLAFLVTIAAPPLPPPPPPPPSPPHSCRTSFRSSCSSAAAESASAAKSTLEDSVSRSETNDKEAEEERIEPDTGVVHLRFPSNLDELKQLTSILTYYAQYHPIYAFTLFASAYVFKQTFAIPGSVFLNLLGGAIYGRLAGFSLCCALTAIGATCCYALARLTISTDWLERSDRFGRHLRSFRRSIDSQQRRNSLLTILISVRLFPMSPNWFLNIASPLVGVPVRTFFISVFFGLMPYNFICVQTGSLLGELRSLDDVLNWRTFATLAAIAGAFVTPALVRRSFARPPPTRLHTSTATAATDR